MPASIITTTAVGIAEMCTLAGILLIAVMIILYAVMCEIQMGPWI